MAFTLDRTEAAKRLGVSTRTVDRHIQSKRIRTRRIGKKMFLEENDVDSLRDEDPARRDDDYIVVVHDDEVGENTDSKVIVQSNNKNHQMAIAEFSRIYNDAQGLIAKKDEVIKELSYKLGRIETELQNSINVGEYRRTTYLLESAKTKNNEDNKQFGEKIALLEKEVQKRNSFIIGLVILFVVVITSSFIFVFYNRLI